MLMRPLSYGNVKLYFKHLFLQSAVTKIKYVRTISFNLLENHFFFLSFPSFYLSFFLPFSFLGGNYKFHKCNERMVPTFHSMFRTWQSWTPITALNLILYGGTCD